MSVVWIVSEYPGDIDSIWSTKAKADARLADLEKEYGKKFFHGGASSYFIDEIMDTDTYWRMNTHSDEIDSGIHDLGA